MTTSEKVVKNDLKLSRIYLDLLEKADAEGWLDRINDADIDDSEGRVTGEYVCGHCGMTSNDPDHPDTCCRPNFIAAGLEVD